MVSHSQPPRVERLIFGITGRIGSGKTTVGRYLESSYGFQYLRYSAVLAEVGWEVMAGGLQAELNRRLIAHISPEGNVAVDGLRHPLDYETMPNSYFPSFHLLFIDSPPQLRFDRLNRKGKYLDFASFHTADSHPVEQQIDSLRTKAALVIRNEGSLQELYEAVEGAIFRFKREGQS